MNIRAVVADVDGVMVGKKEGFNFPLPHNDVITALHNVNQKGIPIILCTAKFYVGIKQIAVRAQLDNPHITDGGALIMNIKNGMIVSEHVIPKHSVKTFTESCIKNDIYCELYSAKSYYTQRSQKIAFTDIRTKLLQIEPDMVESLTIVAESKPIIKMIFFAKDPKKQDLGYTLAMTLGDSINFIWSHHPYLDPWKPGVITAAGVSKAAAMAEVLERINVSAATVLGIGDSNSDWNFMQGCGSVAVVGDKDKDLINLAQTKGNGRYFLAPSVDDHGITEVFKYFQLL